MPRIHVSNRSFQILLALLGACFVTLATVTFITSASLPTDENLFTETPSNVEVARAFRATPIEVKSYRNPLATSSIALAGDSVQPHDLLLSIGWLPARSMDGYQRALAGIITDTTTVTVLRPEGLRSIRWKVRRSDLLSGTFAEKGPAIIVIDVTPGGASDRAGMQPGDYITRINGQQFKTSAEADGIMRQGTSGKATTYEVLRGSTPLTLNVVLAQFGFAIPTLMFSLAGIGYILIGMFLGLKRPGFLAARLIALWMVLLGFFIAVLLVRRDNVMTPYVVARNVLVAYGALFGTVVSFHAGLLFPWQRPISRWHKRGLITMYVLAAVAPVLMRSDVIGYLLLALVIVIGLFVSPPFTRQATTQQRALGRPIRLIGFSALGASVLCIFALIVFGHPELIGVVGVLLILYPLSYLYTIGHYRLFDLDIRVRRNVQYSVLSWFWGGAVTMVLIWVFFALPAQRLLLPNVVINGFSVEVRQEPASASEQLAAQRLVAMLLGVGVWTGFWHMRLLGQRLLDRKYYRTRFDYRRAAKEVSEVLSTKLSMTDLATALVHSLMGLLKLRGAGLVVFRNSTTCCCDAATGVDAEAWRNFACALDARFTTALATHQEAAHIDLLPPDLAAALRAMRFDYVIPIRSKDHLSGAILVGEKLSDTPQSTEDLSFLSGVARQVSVSIENAFLYEGLAEQDRMRHELAIARQIQMGSLPSVTPQITGLDIAGLSTPALEVGGDFFDYLDGSGKDVMVIVGDVSGKGTSAALYMSKVQGILRSLHQFSLAPRDLFQRANRLLCADLQKNSFITASAALFLPKARQVKLVRAGHLPLYRYRTADARVERIVPRGLGLGLSNAGIFATELEEFTQPYIPGDVFVLVTDGVTEARNPAGDEYGEDRLSAAIAAAAQLPALAIRDRIMADLNAFGAGTDPHDDQTIVVVRVS